MFFKRSHRHTAHHENVLGTSLELQVSSHSRQAGHTAEKAVLAEIDRLETIFNAYNPRSELSRWQASNCGSSVISPELASVLKSSEKWREQTAGAYNPAVEALTRIWAEHAARNELVTATLLEQPVRDMQQPLWQVDAECKLARRLAELPCTLNAIAKGYIIDRAAQAAPDVPGVQQCVVNIGGDLRHVGPQPINVGVSNPFSDAENAPAAAVVRLQNQGLATSGNYRRGFHIGERWFSHVLDPRTGRPVEHLVSVSVLAPDTMTADVLATAFCVLDPEHSLQMADEVEVGAFLIDADGNRFSNNIWKQHSISVPEPVH